MIRLTVETEAEYVGGSLDGKLVKPSTGNVAIKMNTGIMHGYQIPNADYPMMLMEYYDPEEHNGKVIFRLSKTEKSEMVEI